MAQPKKRDRDLLRHAIAALAFRATRALKGVPENFAYFSAGHGVRTPVELLSHMANELEVAFEAMHGREFEVPDVKPWDLERERFYSMLRRLDDLLVKVELPDRVAQALIQGPFGDVLAHIGQFTLLRRLAGIPMAEVNYLTAEIEEGEVGEGGDGGGSPGPGGTP